MKSRGRLDDILEEWLYKCVVVDTQNNTMFGVLKMITSDELGNVDGILLEKWGWVSKSAILKINIKQVKGGE